MAEHLMLASHCQDAKTTTTTMNEPYQKEVRYGRFARLVTVLTNISLLIAVPNKESRGAALVYYALKFFTNVNPNWMPQTYWIISK